MKLTEPRIEKIGELLFVGLKEKVAYGEMQNIAGQWQRFMSGRYHEIEHRTPSIPVGLHGPPWSHGPMNIRNARTASAP